MLTRRQVLTTTLATTLATTLTGALAPRAARAGAPAFRIGYQKNGILAVAKERGALETRLAPLGVDVAWTEFSYGPPLLEAMSLGSIDLGQTGDAPPIFAQAARADLVYAAAQPDGGSGAAVLLPADSEIRSVAELKGKRVAFAKGTSAHNLTVAVLEKAGLTYRDIEPVTLAPADGAAALLRGAVDAWTVWDPYFAISEVGGAVRVLVQATDVGPTNNYFLANRGTAGAQPATVAAVIAGLGDVARWCEANRGDVAASLSKATGVPLAATQRTVGRVKYTLSPMTATVVAEQQRIADRFHGLGLIPHPIRIADIVWTPPGGSNG